MKIMMGVVALLFSIGAVAQNQVQSKPISKDIVDQIWKPFIKAFNENNAEDFMALHSKDVVRAIRDDGRVLNYDEYSKVMGVGSLNKKSNQYTSRLELRFTESWVENNLAYQVGIYKSESLRPSGANHVSYGKFNVVLRKENGAWKILVDSDSSEGNSIGVNDFLAARPME